MKSIHFLNYYSNFFNIKLGKNKTFYLKKTKSLLKLFLKLTYRFYLKDKTLLILTERKIPFYFLSFLVQKKKHLFLNPNFLVKGFFSNFFVLSHKFIYRKMLFGLKSRNDFHLCLNLDNFYLNSEIIKSKMMLISFCKTNFNSCYSYNILHKVPRNLLFLLFYELLNI